MATLISLADRYDRGTDEEYQAKKNAWNVCIEWFDGQKSAFWSLVDDNAVPVRKVLAEIDEILASETDVAKPWHDRLRAFRAYCVQQIERTKAETAMALVAAHARNAGMDRFEFSRLLQRASGEGDRRLLPAPQTRRVGWPGI